MVFKALGTTLSDWGITKNKSQPPSRKGMGDGQVKSQLQKWQLPWTLRDKQALTKHQGKGMRPEKNQWQVFLKYNSALDLLSLRNGIRLAFPLNTKWKNEWRILKTQNEENERFYLLDGLRSLSEVWSRSRQIVAYGSRSEKQKYSEPQSKKEIHKSSTKNQRPS